MRILGRLAAALLVLFLAFVLWTSSWPRTPSIGAPNAIAELQSVEIGDLEQWVLIRGEDRANPILFWLHGGPGAAQMPVHRAFNQDLEEDFVVVHWDQRGAGKSNHGGFSEDTMTMDRYVADVREMTRYLKDRFDRDQILLLGHSWGTQIGMRAAHRYPEDYSGFVSVGQVVHGERAGELSYEWLAEQVETHGTEDDRQALEALGEPPFDERERYVEFAQMKDRFGGGMDVGFRRLLWPALRATEYSVLDYVRWLRGATRGSGPMWEEQGSENIFGAVPAVEVPVWFIAGENDYNTPTALVQEYYDMLEAPEKHLTILEGAAHAPFFDRPDRFHEEMKRVRDTFYKEGNDESIRAGSGVRQIKAHRFDGTHVLR